jgi:hypothetical protein
MSGASFRPETLSGAFVVIERGEKSKRRLPFQYNPARLTHRLRVGADGSRHETIELTLELDACQRLESPDDHPSTVELGLLPELAALRSLLDEGTAQRRSSLWGRLFRSASDARRLLLLEWGEQRSVPVRITSLLIREELFDPKLNPIRARARVKMAVVSGRELPAGDIGRPHVKAHRERLEALANRGFESS